MVEAVRLRIPFDLVTVDITTREDLFAEYCFDIPVVRINGHRAFKHRLTEAELEARLLRGNVA